MVFKLWHIVMQQSTLLLLARELHELSAAGAGYEPQHRAQSCRVWHYGQSHVQVIRSINTPSWGKVENQLQGPCREPGQDQKERGAETELEMWLQYGSKVHPGGRARGRATARQNCYIGKVGDGSVQGWFKDHPHGALLLYHTEVTGLRCNDRVSQMEWCISLTRERQQYISLV